MWHFYMRCVVYWGVVGGVYRGTVVRHSFESFVPPSPHFLELFFTFSPLSRFPRPPPKKKQGFTIAEFTLAQCYEYGSGVEVCTMLQACTIYC